MAIIDQNQNDNLSVVAFGGNNSVTFTALDSFFAFLDEEARSEEQNYRSELIQNHGRLVTIRFDLGRILFRYSNLCRKDQGKTFKDLCVILGFEERTAFRFVEDYKQAKAVPSYLRQAALAQGIDIAERKHRYLLKELMQEDDVVDTTRKKMQAAEVLARAIKVAEQAKAKLVMEEKKPDSRQTLLTKFLLKTYNGIAVSVLKKEVGDAMKGLTHYKRGDDEIIGVEKRGAA